MKRLLSLLLVLLFGLPMIAPVLALGSEDSGLPACCRRAGMHHCVGMSPETGVTVRAARCAAYPVAVVTVGQGAAGSIVRALRVGGVVSRPELRARAMARARVAREKARGMRGPPVGLKA